MKTPSTTEDQAFAVVVAGDGTLELHIGPLFDDQHIPALVAAENAVRRQQVHCLYRPAG